MKKMNILKITAIALLSVMISCGGESNETAATDPWEESEPAADKPADEAAEEPAASGLDAKIAKGKATYVKVCQACHQEDGKGLPAAFPPLAESDYLAADLTKSIAGVVNGLEGEITVNGEKFNQLMPKSDLSDAEIADVFTYVLNSFGNKGGDVSESDVAATRK